MPYTRGARVGDPVLVGGYHGKWLPREVAYNVPVSRAGLAAAGGALGAGIVLPLGEGTCPVGEVARIARYLAKESSGQCGPCQLGLPGIARSLSALAEGSGGMGTRAGHRAPRRGLGPWPRWRELSGVDIFVLFLAQVFTDDPAADVFRWWWFLPLALVSGHLVGCLMGQATRPGWRWDCTRCLVHGLCSHGRPSWRRPISQGFPVFLDTPCFCFWLEQQAAPAGGEDGAPPGRSGSSWRRPARLFPRRLPAGAPTSCGGVLPAEASSPLPDAGRDTGEDEGAGTRSGQGAHEGPAVARSGRYPAG